MFGSIIAPSGWSGDRSHPLWGGLVFAVPGWTPNDVAGGLTATISGSAGVVSGPYGVALNQGGASSNFAYSPIDLAIWKRGGVMSGPITVMALHTPTTTAQAILLAFADGNTSQTPFAFLWSLGSNQKYALGNDDYIYGPTAAATSALNAPHCVIGRRFGAQTASPTMDLWVDGAISATTTNTAEDGYNANDQGTYNLAINRWGNWPAAEYSGSGTIHCLYAWARPLSDAECLALTEDPWLMFRRPALRSWSGWLDAAGDGGVSGNLAETLSAATLSAAGAVDVAGTLSRTLGAATLSAAGSVDVSAALAKTLGGVSATLAGSVDVAGTLSKALAAATLAAAGEVTDGVTGSLSVTLGSATLVSAGVPSVAGVLDKYAGTLTLAAAGSPSVAGSLAVALGSVAVAGSGDPAVAGSLSVTLSAASLSATGAIGSLTGALAATLGAATVAGAGSPVVDAALGKTLGAASLSSAGAATVVGTLGLTLGAAAVAGAGAPTVVGTLSKTLSPAILRAYDLLVITDVPTLRKVCRPISVPVSVARTLH